MILFVIIGGLFGLLAGGLLGLLLGAVVGFVVGEFMLRVLMPIGQGGAQEQFLDVTFAVMGALCKADGVVTPDEIRVGKQYFDKLALSADQRRGAGLECFGQRCRGQASLSSTDESVSPRQVRQSRSFREHARSCQGAGS